MRIVNKEKWFWCLKKLSLCFENSFYQRDLFSFFAARKRECGEVY